MMHALHTCGLLHSDTLGSTRACRSPRLFAAYRVLLRLLMPRHPPCALISLNTNLAELCLVSEFFSEFGRSFRNCFYPFLEVLPSYLGYLISSLLFRYSIFKDLHVILQHLKLSDGFYSVQCTASVSASRIPLDCTQVLVG